jgi:hypothetical protein
MKPINNKPPRLALVLLDRLLPASVNDDISGDLIEEFHQSSETLFTRKYTFWLHTLATCWRYNMNSKTVASFGLASISIVIFYVLVVAIIFLSNADQSQITDDAYWTNGAIHLFFFEAEFWRFFGPLGQAETSLNLFINVPSILWFLMSCTLLFFLDKKYQLSLRSFAILALTLLILPYIWGVAYFNLFEVPLKECGPIIAFMWISILMLILPFGFGLIRKVHQRAKTIQA